MWTGSIKRCWHYSLWSEARKHSFMYEVGFLHKGAHKELYAAAIFVNFPCTLQLFHLEISCNLILCTVPWSQQKLRLLTLDQHAWKTVLFIHIFRYTVSVRAGFYDHSCCNYNYLVLTLHILPLLCRVDTIDLPRFFLDISILTHEISSS